MYSFSTKCCDPWDQRIPNPPIQERQFLLYKPPIIPNERPFTTYCTKKEPVGMFNPSGQLQHYKKGEQELMDHWFSELNEVKCHKGVLVNKPVKHQGPVPDSKIWMHGVHYNMDADSIVKPYATLTKDCILPISRAMPPDLPYMPAYRTKAPLLTEIKDTVNQRDKVWNINTSPKRSKDPRC